jgi:hypothetical protein
MNRTAEILRAKGFNENSGPECPYCKSKAILTNSFMVYGSLAYGNIWLCPEYPKCDSFVGVHKNDPWKDYPLGSIANQELRTRRNETHREFDAIWKSGLMNRKEAYAWMQRVMDLYPEDAHIGEFSLEQCDRLITICKAWK